MATATVTLGGLNQNYTGSAISATATTTPAGLTVTFTYNGSATAPTAAGTYTVVGTISSPNYQGSATGTMTIAKATATVTLGGLNQNYTGSTNSATATTTPAGLTVTFTYNGNATAPTAAGNYTVVGTISDPNYQGSATGTMTIAKATPAITWPSPGNLPYGTPLGATQLDATATPTGGTFVYNPPAGTTLPIGTQTLSVSYTPPDTTDYATATSTTTVNVIAGLSLTAIAPTSAPYGSGITTITLTGDGFTPTSVVQLNGAAISSTYVSPTQMTAQIPASFFQQLTAGAIAVFDPTKSVTSSSVPFSVTLPNLQLTFSGPSTTATGEQPTLNLILSQPYPVDITGTMTLTVNPLSPGGPVDPSVQFSTGGTTFNFTIPAGTTTTPNVQIQTGTLAATITVTLSLEANGQPIDQDIQPVVTVVPDAAPVITSVNLARNGNTLTVTVQGYSSTDNMSSADFEFTAAPGSAISDPAITVDVSSEFTAWYSSPTAVQYGSSFSYSQVFNLSNNSATIGSVSVELTNSEGQSNQVTAQ